MTYKIQIIDDEDDLRLLLSMRLKNEGYEVIESVNGLQGVDDALKEHPDLVILDIRMPVMNGRETWRTFKKDDELKNIPILVLTCERLSQDRFWGERVSQSDFITKPFDEERLLEKIKEKFKIKEMFSS